MLFYLSFCVICFAVDETNACSFLSRRRKTPSLLFVHIEAPFEQNQILALSYTTKLYLRLSIFVHTKRFLSGGRNPRLSC
jgi:hypothetical protein